MVVQYQNDGVEAKSLLYSVGLELQAMEAAEKTSKEAAARQFSMCMIDNDKLHVDRIIGKTKLEEFKLPVIGSPWKQLADSCRRKAQASDHYPVRIRIVRQ